MAYVTPKENWVAGEIPVASDLNRIEGNSEANHDAIESEALARTSADATLATDLDAEAAARIAATSSGTYTPSAIGSTNIVSVTPTIASYSRTGSVVTVSGGADIVVTSVSSDTVFRLSFPIASAITSSDDAAGTATVFRYSESSACAIYSDIASDRASFTFKSPSTGTDTITIRYVYMYLVK